MPCSIFGTISAPTARWKNARRMKRDAPIGSLCAPLTCRPMDEQAVTFLLAWHFPNRHTWTPEDLRRWR